MIIYRCRNCGFVLHVFEKVGRDYYGVPTPSIVISWYGGICPRCGSQLRPPRPKDILISIREGRRKRLPSSVKTCRQKILRILVAHAGEWFTVEDLKIMTNCSLKTIYKIINELYRENIIEKTRHKTRFRECTAVRIKNTNSNIEVVYK